MIDSYEKIKIAVPKNIKTIIERDCESFDFRKKDNSLNKNKFINTLIVNYYEEFSNFEKERIEKLKKLAISSSLKGKNVENFIYKIIKEEEKDNKNREELNESISFRPTKNSIYIIDYIENNLLINSYLSEYFRRLFTHYSSLPQYQRERIIFKNQYNKALEAIKNKKMINVFTLNNVNNRIPLKIYNLAVVKEETYNYLLCKDKNGYRSFRLSKIEEILFLNETSSFNDEEIAHFKKMIKYGPQYIYTSKDEEVEIELTKKGINYFKKYYVYRPIVDRIEGYHYFFNCSIEHLFQYFSRFGAECYVIKPKSLRVRLIMYFKNSYRELNKKEKTI